MSRDLLSRYVWLVDTIKRYGAITRKQLDECWVKSSFSDGDPLPRRTFYNYRQAIEDLFDIEIIYNRNSGTYAINEQEGTRELTDWMLNSAAMTDLLSDSRDVADLIFLEDVPSARLHLGNIVKALKERHPVTFDYWSYTRSQPRRNVVVEPYFLKIFRQRWYLTGRNVDENTVKTYALDRMQAVRVNPSTYAIPDSFDAATYFSDSFGIVFNKGEVKEVVLRVDAHQAKYFRALPLHKSQQESISDNSSIFTYRLKISDDFVQELLSYGPRVTVLRPPELRAIITTSIKSSLANYEA